MNVSTIISLIVVGITCIWVFFDAANLGIKKIETPEKVKSGSVSTNMGPTGWFFACLLFWVVGFPSYLVTRKKYIANANHPKDESKIVTCNSCKNLIKVNKNLFGCLIECPNCKHQFQAPRLAVPSNQTVALTSFGWIVYFGLLTFIGYFIIFGN